MNKFNEQLIELFEREYVFAYNVFVEGGFYGTSDNLYTGLELLTSLYETSIDPKTINHTEDEFITCDFLEDAKRLNLIRINTHSYVFLTDKGKKIMKGFNSLEKL